ncbi:MAG: LPXTG cell wall anchor domain-containing protein [bacterium]
MRHRWYSALHYLYVVNMLLFFIGCRSGLRETVDKSKKFQRLPLEVEAQVDKPVAEVGDIIKYKVTINAIPEISPIIPEIGSSLHGLRIINMEAKGPSEIDNRKVWEKSYEMQADIVGSYIIPPVTIKYEDAEGKEYQATTAQLFIEVKSILNADPNHQVSGDIKDIHPLEDIETGYDFYVWVGIIAGILLIVGLVVIWRKRKKVEAPVVRPSHEVAAEALTALKQASFLDEGDFRGYYFRLSEIFREYLESRYRYPAVEKTSEELIPFLEKLSITREFKDSTRSLMKRADMAKFAKFKPDVDIAQKDCLRVEDFVHETAEKPSEEH